MSGDAVLIRPATAADLDAVRALLLEAWHQVYDPILGPDKVAEVTSRWHARGLLAAQIDQPRASFLVAEAGGILVAHGFAAVEAPDTLVVSRLYVRPGRQRRGIGRRVFAALCARHPDCARLRLFVAAENPIGLAFWRREGFAEVREAIEEGARVLHMERRAAAAPERQAAMRSQ
ncbi:MAG TPA: GNAT family N-acetyltransferase [Stellaceae bacterium]|nr:GNAT family N-acetyltransferase [Stellaceae bacterium]